MTINEESKVMGLYEYGLHLRNCDPEDTRRTGVVCAESICDAFNELMHFYDYQVGCFEYLEYYEDAMVAEFN